MKKAIWIAGLSSLMVLSGCTGIPEVNPYQYRYSGEETERMCLYVDRGTSPAISLEVRQSLQAKGFVVRNVTANEALDCERCVFFRTHATGWKGSQIKEAHMEFVHEVDGQKVTESVKVNALDPVGLSTGPASEDDEEGSYLIRSLVERLFPDPVPWGIEGTN